MRRNVEVKVDIDKAFDRLSPTDKEEFIQDHMNNVRVMSLASYAESNIPLDTIMSVFPDKKVEAWLKDNAEKYGYVKKEVTHE